MKELHRARVVAIGSEEDMAAVCRTLLANCDWLEIPDDRPPYSLEELRQQVKKHAEELGGEESGFYYGMVARYTYGDADNRTCRFDIARQPSGLWTACFHYDGETPFQSEDWLYLHEHAGRVPMLAIHACADGGNLVLADGTVRNRQSAGGSRAAPEEAGRYHAPKRL